MTTHTDLGRRYLKLDDGTSDFWTFCACGTAFRGPGPDEADGAWAAHTDTFPTAADALRHDLDSRGDELDANPYLDEADARAAIARVTEALEFFGG